MKLLTLLAALLLAACGSAPPPAQPTGSSPGEVRYEIILSGNPAGFATMRMDPDGTRVQHFEFNDRGRGPKIDTRLRLGERGLPVWMEVTGHDYWKVPVTERFAVENGVARWENVSERGERRLDAPAFYLGLNSAPIDLLAKVLLDTPGGRLPLLPDGEARLERVDSARAQAGRESREVQLYALHGLGYTPVYLWLDEDGELFANLDMWSVVVRSGWESAAPGLAKVQEAADAARQKALAAKLARRPAGPLVIQDARLFDPETGATFTDTTVVVSGNRIQAVGRDGEVQIPPGAEVIDAAGKALLPGLWDMHAHVSEVDGLLNLAAGVTTVRDLANDTDQLLDRKRRWDAGEGVGTRIVMAGFIDGPGPYAGPTKVLVDTEEEALAAVDRYADLGYVQIKLYSSLDTKLVKPIVERAHARGLRVSGHIPQGLSAEQAVRLGFDEIQHINFVFLNFLEGVDTRTPARFTSVAESAVGIDLRSERVRSFLALLKERGTVVDPTVTTFEDIFTSRPSLRSPSMAAVADRLPPQVRRNLGESLPIPEGKEQTYRDSYRALLAMVRVLHDQGIPIVAGTDAPAGFALHRELEHYVEAGIPAPEVLTIATLGAARVVKMDRDLGSIAPGKLADLILVDGDPAARISDIRRVVLTVKDGVVFDPAALYREVGVEPVR
jgi:imidazolonepropionase-like amidohydrolase